MGLKVKIEDKALTVAQDLAMQAQVRFVAKMAKDEGVEYEVMWEVCTGGREYEDAAKFTLGFKLADPAWMIAMFKQPSKKRRRQAAENFSQGLSADEAEIFWTEVFNAETGKRFREEYKNEKKKNGVVEDGTDEEEE